MGATPRQRWRRNVFESCFSSSIWRSINIPHPQLSKKVRSRTKASPTSLCARLETDAICTSRRVLRKVGSNVFCGWWGSSHEEPPNITSCVSHEPKQNVTHLGFIGSTAVQFFLTPVLWGGGSWNCRCIAAVACVPKSIYPSDIGKVFTMGPPRRSENIEPGKASISLVQ